MGAGAGSLLTSDRIICIRVITIASFVMQIHLHKNLNDEKVKTDEISGPLWFIAVSINMLLLTRFCSYFIELPAETERYFENRYNPFLSQQING